MWSDNFVDSGGVRIAVRDYGGAGAPVVLVHGHYGNLANFDELGPALAKHCRVVAYDQRGHGWSESGPITVEHFVADLDAVIGAFGLGRPSLFGGSFGTLVALAAIEAGTPVAGLISEDGASTDFATTVHERAAPPDTPTLVTADVYRQITDGYAALGTVGEPSSARAAVHRADGRYEIRPSPSDLYAKETAFLHVRVSHAYSVCADRALYLAAAGEPPSEERAAQLDALAAAGVTVQSFATGHWISAADPNGVADAVATFIGERR